MISSHDIRRLLEREATDRPVLSVFLDMSVNSENKRTHHIFLNRQRAEHPELASDRDSHHREAIGEAFARIDRWLADGFDEANKGAAVYVEVGGEWQEALQFPVPVRNRLIVADRPVIGPLAQIVETYRHYGVCLVDREHLRLLSVYLGRPLHEHSVRTEPYPTPHDVQRGGYSQAGFQRRKAEEVRHFFKEFAVEVVEFDRRHRPDHLVVLGTDQNVKHFLEFLPPGLQRKVRHTGHPPEAGIEAPASDVIERLRPVFDEHVAQEQEATVARLRERLHQQHRVTAGIHDTLEQLQEGKVDTLVLDRDIERVGAHCLSCGFYLARVDSACPYCGGRIRDGVDIVEAMIRLAEQQDVPIEFVRSDAVTDLAGVGALLRF